MFFFEVLMKLHYALLQFCLERTVNTPNLAVALLLIYNCSESYAVKVGK